MKRMPDDERTRVERTPLPPLDDICATFRLHTAGRASTLHFKLPPESH
jgi:hypothetical protein